MYLTSRIYSPLPSPLGTPTQEKLKIINGGPAQTRTGKSAGYEPDALTKLRYGSINRTSLLSDAGVPGGEKSRPGTIYFGYPRKDTESQGVAAKADSCALDKLKIVAPERVRQATGPLA